MNKTEVMAEPWELAKQEGKTVIVRLMGVMVGVYYPYRRTGDLYVLGPAGKDQIVHCCQDGCDCDIPISDFFKHVNGHNRRLKKYPNIIIDTRLVAPGVDLPIYEPSERG